MLLPFLFDNGGVGVLDRELEILVEGDGGDFRPFLLRLDILIRVVFGFLAEFGPPGILTNKRPDPVSLVVHSEYSYSESCIMLPINLLRTIYRLIVFSQQRQHIEQIISLNARRNFALIKQYIKGLRQLFTNPTKWTASMVNTKLERRRKLLVWTWLMKVTR